MTHKEKIKNVAANFPGLLESDRLDLLNSQLNALQRKGYCKLVENFLSNKNQYTIRPFLFEIYLREEAERRIKKVSKEERLETISAEEALEKLKK